MGELEKLCSWVGLCGGVQCSMAFPYNEENVGIRLDFLGIEW